MPFVLIRHCQTSGQEPDAPLTDIGHTQARGLADFLNPLGIDRIVSSPYRRAVQSVEPLAAAAGLSVHTDERLRERLLSPEPQPDWQDHIARSFIEPEYYLPGGESGMETRRRGLAVLDMLATHFPEERIAIVSHGGWLTHVLQHYDPQIGLQFWRALSNPDVWSLEDGEFRRLWPG